MTEQVRIMEEALETGADDSGMEVGYELPSRAGPGRLSWFILPAVAVLAMCGVASSSSRQAPLETEIPTGVEPILMAIVTAPPLPGLPPPPTLPPPPPLAPLSPVALPGVMPVAQPVAPPVPQPVAPPVAQPEVPAVEQPAPESATPDAPDPGPSTSQPDQEPEAADQAAVKDKATPEATKSDEAAVKDKATPEVTAKVDEKKVVEAKLDPAAALKEGQDLVEEASTLKEKSDNLAAEAKDKEAKSEDLDKKAQDIEKSAGKDSTDAADDKGKATELNKNAQATVVDATAQAEKLQQEAKEQAEKLKQEAKEKAEKLQQEAKEKAQGLKAEAEANATSMKKDAQGLISKAGELEDESAKKKNQAAQKLTESKDLQAQAQELKKNSKDDVKTAVTDEEKGLQETADQRLCIHLPGAKLKGDNVVTFNPIVGNLTIKDEWQCTDWCQKHVECRQSVFQWETATCTLFSDRKAEPEAFKDVWPFFNSSYCGSPDEKEDMLGLLKRVYDAKPWVPPPHNCSWAGENCIQTKCCADMCKATWDFKECQAYTCYQKDEFFASCEIEAPSPKSEQLGGHPNGEVEPAPEGKLVQGVRLYCFSVVMWDRPAEAGWMSSEGELANHWKEQGKNIMQCDDHSLFDGLDGGSVHNIQSFIRAWNLVKDDGRWKNNDWSIKVDPDAVFFPEHFRQKVQYVWRTPQGSAVYLRNTFYKFQFLGALEALSKEAMEVYFDRGWECEAHLGQEGGEDYWMEQCLEGLGLNYQTDVTLLHDKYAADENCGDPNSVAHHFFKKIDGNDGWDACWDTAEKAWNDAHQ